MSKRILTLPLTAVVFFATLAGAAPTGPQGGLPALPGPNGAAPASTAPAQGAPADAGSGFDRVRRGLVVVERDHRPLGAGTVLANDGRVLTALSALGGSDNADVRYIDGHTVKARVGHRDTTWDLALLVPLSGRWTDGLTASEADPGGTELRVVGFNAKGSPVPVGFKGRADVRSKSGDPIYSALDLDLKGQTPAAGTPVLDATGSVVGVLVRACKPADAATCSPIVVGAPVGALRNFLVKTPLNAVTPSPWLGIVGAPDQSGNVRGVRVMAVAPQSPAEKSGLKTNSEREKADLIAAVDGQPVETPERLAELIGKHAIGESVKLLVFGGDKFRELTVVLRPAP